MDAIQKIEEALAAGPTDGDWELCHLNTPLSEIGAYVQKCVDVSGGANYHFIRAVRADGVPVDVAHYGNGPTSNVNGHWATVTRPAAIREVLQTLASKEAELAAREAAIARLREALAVVDAQIPEDFDAAIDHAVLIALGNGDVKLIRAALTKQPPKD